MIRLLFGLLACSLGIAHGQETLMRLVHDPETDTHVEVLALFTEPVPGGYLPVRVTLANNQGRGHHVELIARATGTHGSNDSRCESAFRIAAGAGQVVTRDLLIPMLPVITSHSNASNLVLQLTGTLGSDEHRHFHNSEPGQPRVLLGERIHNENAAALDAAASSAFASTHRGGTITLASRFDPKRLPAEWLAYGGYDRLTITDEEWAEIPPGPRNAILAWVRLGGTLDIRHRAARFERSRLGLPEDAGFGSIAAAPIGADLKLDAANYVANLTLARVSSPRGKSLYEDFDGSWDLQERFGIKPFRFEWFMIVLGAFAILVGPVNLFVLAPAGRRHLLFITTPLISLGASVLMVLVIVFQDGFGGAGSRVVLMEVRPDDGQNAAYIHQEQFSRTGIMSRASFTFDAPVLVHPVPMAPSRWTRLTNRHDSGGMFHLQPSGGGIQATGDWFQSRSEQGQLLSAVAPSRGRIEGNGDGGFVSTFPHRLDVVFLRTSGGTWAFAEQIDPGAPFRMADLPANEAGARLDADARSRLSSRLRERFDRVKIRENHFIAITDAAPAIASHPSIRWRETRTIITGPLATGR